jgi:PBP1b-binding outer membrane lipoprotein LpoB
MKYKKTSIIATAFAAMFIASCNSSDNAETENTAAAAAMTYP